jgi:malate dehydrogenase (oxaloacetate-decarboxylating)(NADP+)
MFLAAAIALASEATDSDLVKGRVFPSLVHVREVSAKIAATVAKVAFERGLATIEEPPALVPWIKSLMYDPKYESYV